MVVVGADVRHALRKSSGSGLAGTWVVLGRADHTCSPAARKLRHEKAADHERRAWWARRISRAWQPL